MSVTTILSDTNGTGISVSGTRIYHHTGIDRVVSTMNMRVGDTNYLIEFKTPEELIEFCEKHNFEYKDERETAAKQEDVA